MRLTEHFDSSEFDAKSTGGKWPDAYAVQRMELAQLLEWLRRCAGDRPGIITSAFRDAGHNALADGTETSQHMKGEAVDVVFPLSSLRGIAERVLDDVRAGLAPRFGQVILYPDRGHVHVSLPTLGGRNGEARLSFMADGNRVYPFLTSASQVPAVTGPQAITALGAGSLVLLLAGAAFFGGSSL